MELQEPLIIRTMRDFQEHFRQKELPERRRTLGELVALREEVRRRQRLGEGVWSDQYLGELRSLQDSLEQRMLFEATMVAEYLEDPVIRELALKHDITVLDVC